MSGYTTPPRQLDPAQPMHYRVEHYESDVPVMMSNKFIPLSTSHDTTQMIKIPVENVPKAFVLLNFFTPEECQSFITVGEGMGFQPAKVSTSGGMQAMQDVRNNERVVWHCKDEWLDTLQERYAPFLPTKDSPHFPHNYDATSCGLNNRLRMYKYTKGQRFVPHFDGGYNKSESVRSWMTFIAYLQAPDDGGGGHTVFFDSNTGQPVASVEPVPGSALFFYHQEHPLSPKHSGQLVSSGTKYALRSDVMFRRV